MKRASLKDYVYYMGQRLGLPLDLYRAYGRVQLIYRPADSSGFVAVSPLLPHKRLLAWLEGFECGFGRCTHEGQRLIAEEGR